MTVVDALNAAWLALGLNGCRSVAITPTQYQASGERFHLLIHLETEAEVRAVAERVGWLATNVIHDGRAWCQVAGTLVDLDVLISCIHRDFRVLDDAGVVL